MDHRVPPGYAPPKHVHRQADEIFLLIEGHPEVTCGGDTWQAGPGSLVFLPRGIPHGFTAASSGPARTLLINAPAGFGEAIVELGDPAPKLDMPAQDAPLPAPDQRQPVAAGPAAPVRRRTGIAQVLTRRRI